MKSIRLSKASREEIAASMVDGFNQNWFKTHAPDYKTIGGVRDDLGKLLEVELTFLWSKSYGALIECLRPIPGDLLSGSQFHVTDGCRVEARHLEGLPGKRNGVDLLLEPDEFDIAFKGSTELRKLISKYDKDRSQFYREVWQVLESVNTTGKLVEVWPAAEQYIPAYLNEPGKGINLPMLHTSRLDEALGVNNA